MKDSVLEQIEEIHAKIKQGGATLSDFEQIYLLQKKMLDESINQNQRLIVQCDQLTSQLLAELKVSNNYSVMLLSGQRGFDVTARC